MNDETDTIKIDGTYSWNGIPAGTTTSFSPSMSKNELPNSSSARLNNYPILGSQARDAKEKMVYFGPWETYFLVAEPWNVSGLHRVKLVVLLQKMLIIKLLN